MYMYVIKYIYVNNYLHRLLLHNIISTLIADAYLSLH